MDLHRALSHVLQIRSEVDPVLIGQLANAAQVIASQKMLPDDGERSDVVVHRCWQHAIAGDDAAGQGQRGPIKVGAASAIEQVNPDLAGHPGPVNARSSNQFWRQRREKDVELLLKWQRLIGGGLGPNASWKRWVDGGGRGRLGLGKHIRPIDRGSLDRACGVCGPHWSGPPNDAIQTILRCASVSKSSVTSSSAMPRGMCELGCC